MLFTEHIDRLSCAIAANHQLYSSFLAEPRAAIDEYNNACIQRFHQRPIELNEAEWQLVAKLPHLAKSIQEVYQLLFEAIESQEKADRYTSVSDLVELQGSVGGNKTFGSKRSGVAGNNTAFPHTAAASSAA